MLKLVDQFVADRPLWVALLAFGGSFAAFIGYHWWRDRPAKK